MILTVFIILVLSGIFLFILNCIQKKELEINEWIEKEIDEVPTEIDPVISKSILRQIITQQTKNEHLGNLQRLKNKSK